MIRSPSFQRPMRLLAFAALLLLLGMPILSRFAGAGTQGHASVELCTKLGLRVVAADAPGLPGPAGSPHDGHCEYCPLLASLANGAPPPLAIAAIGLPESLQPVREGASFAQRHPNGLGSRGPPRSA